MISDFSIATPNEPDRPGVIVTVGHKRMSFPTVSFDQMQRGHREYCAGALIQQAFPFLSAEEREFLMTGITPEEWDEIFPQEETD